MAGFSDFLYGSPARNEQISRYTPQQQSALNQLLSQGVSRLNQPQQQGYDWQQQFQPIAQQARTNFNQQTVPGLAERFTSMGSGSGLSSPAFASQLGQAGAGLEGNLAALQAQYGQQGEQLNQSRQGMDQNYLLRLLQGGLTPQFDSLYHEEDPGFAQQGLQSLLQIAPSLIGGFFGGSPGAVGGQAIGSLLAQLLSSQGNQGQLNNQSNRIGSWQQPNNIFA